MSFDPATGTVRVVYQFPTTDIRTDQPSDLVAVAGKLYASQPQSGRYGHGSVFSVDTTSGSEAGIYDFTGGPSTFLYQTITNPGLIQANGRLFGVSPNGGAYGNGSLFQTTIATGSTAPLYSFTGNLDGGIPRGRVLLKNNVLYGGSSESSGFFGKLFAFSLATHTLSDIFTFSDKNGFSADHGLVPYGGLLYGVAAHSLFSVDPATGAFTTLQALGSTTDNVVPSSRLLLLGGALFGTVQTGPAGPNGAVFKYDIAAGAYSVLHSFTAANDGQDPQAGLTALGGKLYGTTSQGGTGSGTVYSVDPVTGAEAVLHAFGSQSTDGSAPAGGLVALGGFLYGTTSAGGKANQGTIFRLDRTTGKAVTIYSFKGAADGSTPAGDLIAVGPAIYGTTSYAGQQNLGTIFKLVP